MDPALDAATACGPSPWLGDQLQAAQYLQWQHMHERWQLQQRLHQRLHDSVLQQQQQLLAPQQLEKGMQNLAAQLHPQQEQEQEQEQRQQQRQLQQEQQQQWHQQWQQEEQQPQPQEAAQLQPSCPPLQLQQQQHEAVEEERRLQRCNLDRIQLLLRHVRRRTSSSTELQQGWQPPQQQQSGQQQLHQQRTSALSNKHERTDLPRMWRRMVPSQHAPTPAAAAAACDQVDDSYAAATPQAALLGADVAWQLQVRCDGVTRSYMTRSRDTLQGQLHELHTQKVS